MNSSEIAIKPNTCNQMSGIKVLRVRVSPGDSIAPDKPIMDVLTGKDERITLWSPISGLVTRCPVAPDDTIGPDEPLLFLTPTGIETDEGSLHTVALEEPLEEPFVAQNRVPFTVQIGDHSESDVEVLESREPDSKRRAPTKEHTIGEVRKLYLPLDKNKKPRKVGDGSYSIVFEAEDNNRLKYALKVLYDRQTYDADKKSGGSMALTLKSQVADYAVTQQRFETECRSMRDIRRVIALRDKLPASTNINSIVKHIGQTVNLSKELSSVFDASGLKLSDLGLVTELYQGTLKDILEKPRKTDSKETGYEILSELEFKDRICAILPFIYSIADGLSIMHEAGYVHLDLKPANIFWRRVGQDGFEAAIGDLGYIRPADNDPPVTSDLYAALGTLHYRSPEQKDFKDFCEVDIWPSEKPEEILLTTNDPKFMGTIVEPGDNLIFLNDLNRSFRIERIILKDGGKDPLENCLVRIYIRSIDKYKLNPDQRTQAVIYKNQSLRTDLFGFGAIVYDLLTCGKSAERFYNNLILDDALRTSVTSIADNYGHIERRSRRDPKYSHIFEPFYDVRTKKYAPKEVVTLILKCMLYRAKGTYFDSNKTNPFNTFNNVLADVTKLITSFGNWNSLNRNPLVSPVWTKQSITTPSSPNALREEISEQQDVSTEKTISTFPIRRVAWAAIRLTQLIRLVRQTLRLSKGDPEQDDRKFYFPDLAPENISALEERLEIGERGYSFRKDFMTEMLEDVVHTRTILYDSQDPYSSFEHMGDIRRRVKLKLVGNPPTWRYRFLESSRTGDSIKQDDWIVVPGKCVAFIEMSNEDRLTLKPVLEKNGDEYLGFEEELKAGETFFLRNLDPLAYCASMLGTYVYQLLFVGFSGNSISEPESIQSLKAQLKASPSRRKSVGELLRNTLYQPAYQEGASCSQNWSAVYRRFTALYVALSLPEPSNVFMHKNLLEELVRIWEDSICRDITRILGLRQESFFSDPTNLTDLSAKLGLSDDSGHLDEASQKVTEGIVSAANLVVHVRNILMAAHSSVEGSAAPHA